MRQRDDHGRDTPSPATCGWWWRRRATARPVRRSRRSTSRPSKLTSSFRCLGVDGVDDAEVAVEDLLVVVVLDLHHLVADAEGRAEPLDRGSSPGGLSACLQIEVQRARTERRRGSSGTAPGRRGSGRGRSVPGCGRVTICSDLGDAVLGSCALDEMKVAGRRPRRASSGICPWLMRWALMMIRLSAAWRNTSVSRTTGTAPMSIRSASTWPGPTEGSWSTSPTRSSAASVRHRLQQRVHQRHVDHRRLVDDEQVAVQRVVLARAGSRRASGRPRAAGGWSSPRGRCSRDSRLAARPVGAARAIATPLAPRICRIALTSVVLPTPGPPVMTSTFAAQGELHRLALAGGERRCPVLLSTHGMRLGGVDRRPGRPPLPQRAGAARRSPARRDAGRQEDARLRRRSSSAITSPSRQFEPSAVVDDLGRHLQQRRPPAGSSSSRGRPQWPSSIASHSA